MKASVFYGPNNIQAEEVEKPMITGKEVLLKVKACGVCGTDLHKAKESLVPPGTILGHEYAGEIVEVGNDVTQFSIGDRVTGAIHVPCFTCHQCQRGHYTLCPSFKNSNIAPGGFAEYIRLSEAHVKHLLFPIPDSMSYVEASLAEPVACCLHGQKVANIHSGDRVLVLGAGPIGLIHAQLLQNKHVCEVFVTDISDFRLQKAKELGADTVLNTQEESLSDYMNNTSHPGFDVVIIAAGVSTLLQQALHSLRRGGTVICFSPFTANSEITIDAQVFFRDEISIVGTYSVSPYEFEEAIIAIEQGTINVKGLVTHKRTLEEFGEATKLVEDKKENALKIVLTD